MGKPKRLGEIISKSRVVAPEKKSLLLELIENNWEGLVGERCSHHCRPTRITRGALVVAADGPSWASEISMMTGELLKNVNRIVGKRAIWKVRVDSRAEAGSRVVGPSVGSRRKESGHAAGLEVSGEVKKTIGRLEDKELREALMRLARARGRDEEGREEET